MSADELTTVETMALASAGQQLGEAAHVIAAAQRTIDDVVGNMERRGYQGKAVDALREAFDVVESMDHGCRSVVEAIRKALAR